MRRGRQSKFANCLNYKSQKSTKVITAGRQSGGCTNISSSQGFILRQMALIDWNWVSGRGEEAHTGFIITLLRGTNICCVIEGQGC